MDDRPFNEEDFSRPHHEAQDRRRETPPSSPQRGTLKISTHPTGAVNAAKKDLFTTTHRTTDHSKPKTAALNIATAQRLVLADLQHDIALRAEAVLRESAETSDIELLGSSIKEYCAALRDLEYMREWAARYPDDERDPFYMKSSKLLQRQAMEDAGLIPNHMQLKGRLPGTTDRAPFANLPWRARSVANEEAERNRLMVRFIMAMTGGLALIIPMLVMTYVPGKNVSVVTTIVAMVTFAAAITWGTQLAPDQVLGATAAYAAVLVVFVGTSLTI